MGKTVKIKTKQIRGYNLVKKNIKDITIENINLFDILINLEPNYLKKLVEKNKNLFVSKESKNYIKSKLTENNEIVISYFLKIR